VNGKRVAQLLASEIEGHEGRGLGDLAVVEAEREAEPSPEGTRAYAVAEGEKRVASVDLYPEYAALVPEREGVSEAARGAGLEVRGEEIVLPDGPSVKRVLSTL
jgi:hypothetical protein